MIVLLRYLTTSSGESWDKMDLPYLKRFLIYDYIFLLIWLLGTPFVMGAAIGSLHVFQQTQNLDNFFIVMFFTGMVVGWGIILWVIIKNIVGIYREIRQHPDNS